mmetsp:Transcript_30617/g.74607  ORF Transcript_30617/g.74607 Transcript_30617/m.74607 type:complete len:207 (-) Transcript_30617:1383-2003(-)
MENVKKSTSLHLGVLSQEGQCAVRAFPEAVPAYDPTETVLLFPDEKSTALSEGKIDLGRLKTVVVVESTWQKAAGVARHPNLVGIPTVKIEAKEGTFWRYQELGNGFLSTLEATFYFLVEHWNVRNGKSVDQMRLLGTGREDEPPSKKHRKASSVSTPSSAGYPGCYDDLMLIYANQHRVVMTKNKGNSSKRGGPKHWRASAAEKT